MSAVIDTGGLLQTAKGGRDDRPERYYGGWGEAVNRRRRWRVRAKRRISANTWGPHARKLLETLLSSKHPQEITASKERTLPASQMINMFTIAALASLGQSASAQSVVPSSGSQPAAKAKMICRGAQVTGSRLGAKKRCLTEAQWAAEDEDSKNASRNLTSAIRDQQPPR